VANLNSDQMQALQNLIEGLQRLDVRARDLGDVFEGEVTKKFDTRMKSAADAAALLAKSQTALALSTRRDLTNKQRQALIEAAGKRAAAAEQRKYDDNVKAVRRSMEELGNTVVKLTGSIYKGERGAGVMAGAASDAADSIGKVAFLMGGPMTKALTVAITTLFKFGKVAAEQSDKLFVSYTNLQKSGAAAADGMTGVLQMAQSFGMGVQELEKLENVISQNSQILTVFQGNVMDGSRALSGVARGIIRTDLLGKFMNMGMSLESIQEGIANYISIQSRVGLAQGKTQAQLTKGAAQYLVEMDGLTKLTGIQRKELEDGINKARAIEQFRATTERMRRSGNEQQQQAAFEAEKAYAVLLQQNANAAQGFAESFSGFITTDAGRQFFHSIESTTGVIEQLRSGSVDAVGGLQQMYKAADQSVQSLIPLAEVGASAFAGDFSALADMAQRAGFSQEEVMRMIQDVQAQQQAGADGIVDAQAKTRISQMESMLSLQNFTQLGVLPATVAMQYFTRAVETVTSILPGGGRPGAGFNQLGYGAQGAGTMKGSLGATAAGAATGAAIGSFLPGIGTAIGGVIGAGIGFLGYEAHGGASLEDILTFGGASGSRENFMALDPKVREAVILAAQEYKQLTGEKLRINSGKRSREDQERLYNEYLARGRTGMPVAPPGRSSHESGLAVDIQQGKGDQRAIDILNRYGLIQNVPNDPVHFADRKSTRLNSSHTAQ